MKYDYRRGWRNGNIQGGLFFGGLMLFLIVVIWMIYIVSDCSLECEIDEFAQLSAVCQATETMTDDECRAIAYGKVWPQTSSNGRATIGIGIDPQTGQASTVVIT